MQLTSPTLCCIGLCCLCLCSTARAESGALPGAGGPSGVPQEPDGSADHEPEDRTSFCGECSHLAALPQSQPVVPKNLKLIVNGFHYDLTDPNNVEFIKTGEGRFTPLKARFEEIPNSGGAHWLVPELPFQPGAEYAFTLSRMHPNTGMVMESDLASFVAGEGSDDVAPTFDTVEVEPALAFVGNEGCQTKMISFRVLGWRDEFATTNYVGVLAELRKGNQSLQVMGWMSPLSGGGAVQSELYLGGCPIPAVSGGVKSLSFGGEVDLTLRFYDWAGNLSQPYETKYVLPSRPSEPNNPSRSSSRCSTSVGQSEEALFAVVGPMLCLIVAIRRRVDSVRR